MDSVVGEVVRALHGRPRSRVVVLSRADGPPPVAVRLAGELSGARVTVLDPGAGLEGFLALRRESGPADAIVDLLRGRVVERAQSLLLHLAPGGVLVSRLPDDAERRATATSRLRELGAEHTAARRPEAKRRRQDRRPNPERDREWCAWALDEVRVEEHHAVLRSRARALAKVRDSEADDLLVRRPTLGRVVETHPAEHLVAAGTVDSSSGRHGALPASYDVPATSLRRYDAATCLPGGVLLGEDVVLPESFRRPSRARLRHLDLADVARDFVLAPEVEPRPLAGAWFHLDHEIRGHFGHATTEQLAHVWGWARARELEPDLRVLLSRGSGLPVADWELDLLAAAGVPRDRVEVVDEPVVVERLYATSQLFDNPGFVSPRLVATWDAVGAAFEADALRADPDRAWPERVFLTRRRGNRTCHNAAEVEERFARAGFEVVLPEELPLATQVTLVRRARVVGGFAGSGMFHLMFSPRPQHVVTVGSESYSAQNEWLFAAVRGHHLDLVECRPDVPFAGRWDQASFQSDFTFDPDREGVFLDRVLARLP